MSDWPSHSEELARKSLELLERRALQNAEGKFSDGALLVVADTLSTMTQGVIPDADWQTIYAVELAMRDKIGSKK